MVKQWILVHFSGARFTIMHMRSTLITSHYTSWIIAFCTIQLWFRHSLNNCIQCNTLYKHPSLGSLLLSFSMGGWLLCICFISSCFIKHIAIIMPLISYSFTIKFSNRWLITCNLPLICFILHRLTLLTTVRGISFCSTIFFFEAI